MAFLDIGNIEIKGISACVPRNTDKIEDIYIWDGAEDFIKNTGIKERRKSPNTVTSVDLCYVAAKKLIEDLGWDEEEVDAIIFVSQTPDYILPSSSCILQSKLGLSSNCFTLDVSLGCSGWVYGLSVLGSLMQTGQLKKGLLLAGDTITKICSPNDKSTFPLFGDAGTATAIEWKPGAYGFKFNLKSDGKGENVIKVKDGGCRCPINDTSFSYEIIDKDISRRSKDLILEGMDVFSFGISKAPKSVKELLEHFDIPINDVDLFIFHQANKMMNEMIRKKLKLEESKTPYSIDYFGNTSCASIPLTLVTKENNNLETKKLVNIASGFGVGLSWASVCFVTDKIVIPPLLEL